MNGFIKISAARKITPRTMVLPPALASGLRRADDLSRLAVAAAAAALSAAAERHLPATARGLFFGTAFGPLETTFRFLDSLIDEGEGKASPTTFSHSVHNAAAGYIARLLDIQGPALTITSFAWPFLTALNEARLAISLGRVERTVVVAAETEVPLLKNAASRRNVVGKTAPNLLSGAIAWVLDRAGKEERSGTPILVNIEISEQMEDPWDLLVHRNEAWSGAIASPAHHGPLGHAFALTELLDGLRPGNNAVTIRTISAPFGHARIEMLV